MKGSLCHPRESLLPGGVAGRCALGQGGTVAIVMSLSWGAVRRGLPLRRGWPG
jgi:hypothetical protein